MIARHKTFHNGLKLLSAVLAGCTFIAMPVNAEKLYSKLSAEEARDFSGSLKTFICLGERLTPDWCESYRRSKLVARVRPPKPIEPQPQKASAVNNPAVRYILEFAEQPDLEEAPEIVVAEPVKEVAVEETKRQREWKVFKGKGDYTSLSATDVAMLTEMSQSGLHPQANEILGFAYTNGSGVLAKSKVKAYREYGKAYLKGLVRVKPNMDVLWKQFTKSEQYALIHEFKKLRKEAEIASSSLKN